MTVTSVRIAMVVVMLVVVVMVMLIVVVVVVGVTPDGQRQLAKEAPGSPPPE